MSDSQQRQLTITIDEQDYRDLTNILQARTSRWMRYGSPAQDDLSALVSGLVRTALEEHREHLRMMTRLAVDDDDVDDCIDLP